MQIHVQNKPPLLSSINQRIKIDPSSIQQEFSNVHIKLLCCRYWILEEWQCRDLSVPFWRIYHNRIEGAKIFFDGKLTQLNENILVIIPPNTSFSTRLGDRNIANNYENIMGRKIEQDDWIAKKPNKNEVDHLFIHFTLGFPLDFAQSGIYTISSTPDTKKLLEEIKTSCLKDTPFGPLDCIRIKQLINSCLLKMEDSIWKFESVDARILTAMKTIEKNFNQGISNADLADTANMAVNSFARLFKTSTRLSIQQYITKAKIEAACNLMHHSTQTIDEIAYNCGFYDRHHFSKIFKRQMKVNPSYYLKNLIIN